MWFTCCHIVVNATSIVLSYFKGKLQLKLLPRCREVEKEALPTTHELCGWSGLEEGPQGVGVEGLTPARRPLSVLCQMVYLWFNSICAQEEEVSNHEQISGKIGSHFDFFSRLHQLCLLPHFLGLLLPSKSFLPSPCWRHGDRWPLCPRASWMPGGRASV